MELHWWSYIVISVLIKLKKSVSFHVRKKKICKAFTDKLRCNLWVLEANCSPWVEELSCENLSLELNGVEGLFCQLLGNYTSHLHQNDIKCN